MRRLFNINRINHLTRTFSCLFHSFKIRLIAFLGLFTAHNDKLSLPFQIPDAGKRYPLEGGATPHRGIRPYREYPRDPFASKEVPTYDIAKNLFFLLVSSTKLTVRCPAVVAQFYLLFFTYGNVIYG